MHSSPGTYELFKTQAAEAADELRQAEQALAALGRSDNLLNLDTQKKDAIEAINNLSNQLDALAAEIREQSTRAQVADTQLASVPERVPTQRRNVPNQYSVERLHTMLVELNNKRTEMLTKFRADDRLVVELDQQITDTTAAMERAQGISANEESTDVNPAWQALVTERMRARLALSGLESKAQQLRRELAERQRAGARLHRSRPRVRRGGAAGDRGPRQPRAVRQAGRRSAYRRGAGSPAHLERRPGPGAGRARTCRPSPTSGWAWSPEPLPPA